MLGRLFKNRQHLQEARRLRRSGDFVRSGEFFELAGHTRQAMEMYRKGRSHLHAAHLSEKLGRFRDAAAHYETAGQHEAAARLYLKAGDSLRGAQALQKALQFFQAGVLYEQDKSYRDAAACFERSGQLQRAANNLIQIKDHKNAARIFRTLFDRRPGSDGLDPETEHNLREMARAAAISFEKVKDYERAAEAFRIGQEWKRAAELYLRLQRPRDAAEMYFQVQEYDKALALVRNYGLAEFEAAEFGTVLAQDGRHRDAAMVFEAAGDCISAAEQFQEAGELERAGRLYEEAGDLKSAAYAFDQAENFVDAARIYLRAALPERAAEAMEKSGQSTKAASLYSSLGRHLEAARLYLLLDRDDEAIAELQKVPREDEFYFQAIEQMGRIFQRKKLVSLAARCYRDALQGFPFDNDTRPLYFELALTLEQLGREKAALGIYRRIASLDFTYRDVGKHVQDLVARLSGEIPIAIDKFGSEASRDQLFPGQLFAGRYKVLERIGDGGMGIVYKVQDLDLDEIIALKLLTQRTDPSTVERLKRELRLTRKLHHPNIVRLFHFAEIDGQYFITMEFVEGSTLKEVIRENGCIHPIDAVPLLIQIARALQAAHDAGVIHRDIKPQNILVDSRQVLKVVDFGIARAMDESHSLTITGDIVGTPDYMSPEQINDAPIDARADLYSLGIVAFELVTGTVPFRGESPLATVVKHLKDAPPRPSSLQLISPELESIILRLLKKRPENRFASANDLIEALHEL